MKIKEKEFSDVDENLKKYPIFDKAFSSEWISKNIFFSGTHIRCPLKRENI